MTSKYLPVIVSIWSTFQNLFHYYSFFFKGQPNITNNDNHSNQTHLFIHPHLRKGQRITKRTLHLITTITLVVTLILASMSLYYMWWNYKKRWRMQETACGINDPPVSDKFHAVTFWFCCIYLGKRYPTRADLVIKMMVSQPIKMQYFPYGSPIAQSLDNKVICLFSS